MSDDTKQEDGSETRPVEQVVMPPPPLGSPRCPPRCEHDRSPGHCPWCAIRDRHIREAVKPLADEFWEHRGQRDIEHLLYRAYRMGMQHRDHPGPYRSGA